MHRDDFSMFYDYEAFQAQEKLFLRIQASLTQALSLTENSDWIQEYIQPIQEDIMKVLDAHRPKFQPLDYRESSGVESVYTNKKYWLFLSSFDDKRVATLYDAHQALLSLDLPRFFGAIHTLHWKEIQWIIENCESLISSPEYMNDRDIDSQNAFEHTYHRMLAAHSEYIIDRTLILSILVQKLTRQAIRTDTRLHTDKILSQFSAQVALFTSTFERRLPDEWKAEYMQAFDTARQRFYEMRDCYEHTCGDGIIYDWNRYIYGND